MERILEPEAMDDQEEAIAYDALVSDKQGAILDECFSLSALNMLGPKGRILDIGTGTGRIALKIAQQVPGVHITGIDLSENMLAVARKNKEATGGGGCNLSTG